jgi:mannosylglycerate hydrolase MGH1-like protein
MIDRRTFLGGAAAFALGRASARAEQGPQHPEFRTANARWQAAYDRALAILAANVQVLPHYDKPVLIEGANYAGIWLECGPHEALVYRKFRPDVARNSHLSFFALQRPDGQFPANNKVSETGFGQIQMVVPIAATAWELARSTGDDELLHTAYRACSAWDDWLMAYRNTRGTGLIEGFCTYDTGHDNSPRWNGIPPQCPDKDAKKHAVIPSLPRLCPDLSATVYGGRVALSAMAKAIGKATEADRWTERAEEIRELILSRLYVQEDAAFYDLDAQNHFVKIRCDILSRICGEHIPDQALFDDLWTRQIHNPKAFWAPWPLPSVALDDPLFVRPIPRNSWGGASQALTALRAGRWFDHYGRPAEFGIMMDRWCDAMQADMSFRQQLDPLNGNFTKEDMPNYSPAALVMLDYTWRLAGVREEGDSLEWNARPGHPAAQSTVFRMRTDAGQTAEMKYDRRGAELRLGGKALGRIDSGTARLVTDSAGVPKALVGISEQPQTVTLRLTGRAEQKVALRPNARVAL